MQDAVTAYRASHEFGKKTQRGAYVDGRLFDNHILHRIGPEKLAAIDVPAVKRLIRQIENDTRTGERKKKLGGPGIARKAVRVLSALMTWCVGEGKLATNPIIGNLRLTGDGQRDTIMGTPEEYAALYATMDDLVATGPHRSAPTCGPSSSSRP